MIKPNGIQFILARAPLERKRERKREREKEKTLPRSTFRFLRDSENGQTKEKSICHLASVTPNISTLNLTPSPRLSKRET
ncbi:hypothetical protein POVWA1_027420 [Plasmodium ovale wallikeri]|uniref:Uncharacterized protein n=1 Tax=Plasmodium ovale wallikeri TaxID=864142 RepID=A0A1A8YUZ3_PLAOA|nr:hypothetical protein POVWA1_027420 [Plasmodium ovale wallikeri]